MSFYVFVLNSILLGIGLAMDAFSVSIANGIHDPTMKGRVKISIAGTFAVFQFLMPMVGWMLVHFLMESFVQFEKLIPWIALILLLYIGGKMIFEAFKNHNSDEGTEDIIDNGNGIRVSELIIQGIATSIDALSVGFTIADYECHMAFICSLIIAVVTFIICEVGLKIGIKVGMRLANKASVFGGAILIFIGLEIFIKGIFM